MRVLALGTYPTLSPVHGGQRRCSRIGDYYRAQGCEYRYACVYDPRHYGASDVTDFDTAFGSMGGIYARVPFIDDLASGVFAATEQSPYAHFAALIEQWAPDVIQLEQPFMWPLVRRLRSEGRLDGVRLVYSSHNVEGPLKREILESAGVERKLVNQIGAEIDSMEAEIVAAANVLITVSHADDGHYSSGGPGLQRIVIRNGADRPGDTAEPAFGSKLLANEYLVFVGSAYPPNIDGFKRFVLSGDLYGFPPQKRFAICGGVADSIYQSELYAPHAESYQDRVQFFGRPSDEELAWLRDRAKGFLLPIESGGGSNLKTAEALASGRWVIATTTALRSFEDFMCEKGVIVADTPNEFQDAMLGIVYGKPLSLSRQQTAKREGLFWEELLERSGLFKALSKKITGFKLSGDWS